ncbi:MAG: hypothetical protein HZA08_00585 [Nitrospirae bacterium]|nr:hypothetical protein [Nitrospirota bacterium]
MVNRRKKLEARNQKQERDKEYSLPFKGMVRVGMGFTNGHENKRDKNVPPILVEMDRRGFPTPPEEIFE